MATEFRARNFSFGAPGTQEGSAQFSNTVRDAAACLQGYEADFGDNDHHLKEITADIRNVRIEETRVVYDVVFNLVDGRNNKGRADINVVVVADVESR